MIYITGDMHGEVQSFNRKGMNKIKKKDSLIICGDFGFIWNGNSKEEKLLKKIGKRKYKVLFVEGCHENYSKLSTYPIVDFCGGKARNISGNLYQLLRGEVYTIDDKKVFTFGGGYSSDQEIRMEANSWWAEESPTEADVENAMNNLEANNYEVDIVITHDVPKRILGLIDPEETVFASIHSILEQINSKLKFNMWYFGKYHTNKFIPPRYRNVYNEVSPVK